MTNLDQGQQAFAATSVRWGDVISRERQIELSQRLLQWEQTSDQEKGRSPYDRSNSPLRLTGADVFWLAAQALMRSHDGLDVVAAEQHLRDADQDSFLNLSGLNLAGAYLNEALLTGAYLAYANLTGVYLARADLMNANLDHANLAGAYLGDTQLMGASLLGSDLARCDLFRANLGGATLCYTNLAGANLFGSNLAGADLREAQLDSTTFLRDTMLGDESHRSGRWRGRRRLKRYGSAKLGDVHWGGVDVTAADWDGIRRLGDESLAGLHDGISKHRAVVRAYRQVAQLLRQQGMAEEADRFLYCAQVCKRKVLLRQSKVWQYLGSCVLAVLAGYGYRPGRSILWYLATILSFGFLYFQVTHGVFALGLVRSELQPLTWYEALVLSVSSFHGRGFFQPVQSLGDPVAILAAAEAILGLLIEVSFIATFTQRFFGSR
jgi:hypothetical protein